MVQPIVSIFNLRIHSRYAVADSVASLKPIISFSCVFQKTMVKLRKQTPYVNKNTLSINPGTGHSMAMF